VGRRLGRRNLPCLPQLPGTQHDCSEFGHRQPRAKQQCSQKTFQLHHSVRRLSGTHKIQSIRAFKL
jgi:hypothetical protein